MGPPPGALPPMRMTASWSGSQRTYRIQVCGAKMRPNGELPSDHCADGRRQTPSFEEKPISLFIVPPRAQASRRCENTSDAKAASRQAALAFRSLDPFRALREPDRRRRDEERLFRSEQRTISKTQRTISGSTAQPGEKPLDRKSPIQVCCELDLGRIPSASVGGFDRRRPSSEMDRSDRIKVPSQI
jgi:hypothetical protein